MFAVIAKSALALVATFLGACEGIAEKTAAPVETLAWCGVHPDNPNAGKAVSALAVEGGIDATFGPCMAPGADYSPANTGQRYVDPDTYMRLVQLNASVGMKTFVYDARLWSEDSAVRQNAVDFWWPVRSNIAGWDMGDEFDPRSEMDILINRWKIVAGLGTGIEPFTNQLPNNPLTYGSAIDRWIREMPEAARTRIAFDSYVLKDAQTHANWYDHWTDNLTCAVNALTHGEYVVTDTSIESTMTELKKVGCDSFIIFGGETPIGTGPMFGTQSLVDANGNATSWASAVMRGATASQK